MFRLENKEILVTGAGGFVGSHLVERLLENVNHVRCFLRYTSSKNPGFLKTIKKDNPEGLDLVFGDIRDQDALRQAMSGIDIVFHLAAIVSIPYSYKHPQEVIETNTIGTTQALIAARDAEIDKFVHTSSSEVYGSAMYTPIDEAHPLQGQSPYSASKIGADKIAESFRAAYGVPVTTIRPFNMYGPRQSGRAVIPTIIQQALVSDRIELGSLYPTRDFTYVEDTVEAFVKIAINDDTLGRVYNVGNNEEISIGDLAEKIIRIIGSDVEIQTKEKRVRPNESEVDRLQGDNKRAQNELDWEPRFSLEDGLRKTIQWISNNLEFYSVGEYQV